MFFIRKDQVDADVEKIREHTLSPEQLQKKTEKEQAERKKAQENLDWFGWKDILAMSIAVIEIILPYMLVFAATMVLVFLFFWWMAHH